MYNDPQNILYMTFLKSVLGNVQMAIKSFEGEKTDLVKLLDCLISLVKSVSSRVLNPLAKVDKPIDGYISPRTYLGYLFESKAAEVHLPEEVEKNIRSECVAFVSSLTNELCERLPDNIKTLQETSVQHVCVWGALQPMKSFGEIEKKCLLCYSPNDIDKII